MCKSNIIITAIIILCIQQQQQLFLYSTTKQINKQIKNNKRKDMKKLQRFCSTIQLQNTKLNSCNVYYKYCQNSKGEYHQKISFTYKLVDIFLQLLREPRE
eukprot:TRINITY_DN20696_c0_g2_i1.p4 TRINITY_DN20696_c0_g2~~TRINITY_DN20696_c0_g2_i1.p4  ORF type:complete len:101 (+),score=3.02 TRINITY_DN20696_c0_g2_i1:977-1279(+)